MALVNRRRNPIDSSVSAVTITDEEHTIAELDELPGVYGFILEERPVAGTVSVKTDDTAQTPFTIVLSTPLPGQVFVDFNENRGYCIFNSADDGKAVLVTYNGAGANNSVENIRAIADEQIAAKKSAASGIVALNANRQINMPNTAGTVTSVLTNANTAARTVTLPNKSGTVAFLDDITSPDLGPIIDAATAATDIDDTDKFAAARDASENLISIAFSLLKSKLKTYFDTLYGVQIKYAKLSDTKSAGTSGGTLSTSTWNTRTLNTEDNDSDNIVSLSSNQFTLQAGTYRIHARVPAYAVKRHKAKLRNVTDSADVIIGSAEHCEPNSNVVTHSVIVGEFTITATKTFEVQHRIEISNGASDAGHAWNVGVNEVYTIVEIWKIG
jgi:hypothetical protein